MGPVSVRSAGLTAVLFAVLASCTGEQPPVAPPSLSPDSPLPKVDVKASPGDDAVMMVRTPSPWAARGERGGTTLQLDAAVFNPKGKELERKRHIEWSSTDTMVATVDSTGLVTAQDTGRVTIVVDHKKSADSVRILVIPVPVKSVTVAGVDSVSVDDTTAFVATTRDSVGEPLIGRTVTWTAEPAGIVGVSPERDTSEVVALAVGEATVSATSEGKVGTKMLRVWPQPVATVTVTPGEASVPMFRSVTLTATLRDRRGKILTDRAVTWSSSAEGVLTVSSGKVTTVDMGQATVTAESEGKVGTATVTVTNPVEARALWVTRFDYTGPGLGPPRIATIMQKAASANFNIVYFQVRTAGDALYTPRPGDPIEPCSPRLCPSLGSTLTPPYDPLAVAIAEAAKYGIEVHAWLNAYTGWIAGSSTACNQLTQNPNPQPQHMVREHPEWLVVDINGARQPCLTTSEYVWVSPGIPEVRTRLAAVAADIARRYPGVKGIHLDRIRYPGTAWSYDAPSVNAFKTHPGNPTGAPPTSGSALWADLRRGFVNAGVREVFDSVRTVNPSLVLSAAVFPGYQPIAGWAAQWGYRDLFQDPSAWAQGGYLDVNVSMSYPATATSTSWTVKSSYCANVDWVCALDNHRSRIEQTARRHVYVGVGAIKGWTEVERQLTIGHEKLVTGFSVFDFTKVDVIRVDGMDGWQLLARGPFKHPALVPSMPWK